MNTVTKLKNAVEKLEKTLEDRQMSHAHGLEVPVS